jgi:cytochrome c553
MYNPPRLAAFLNNTPRLPMIRNGRLIVAVCAAMLSASAGAAGGDAQAGHNKAAMCQGCHGIDGYRVAFPEVYSVPRLGGQHQAYIVKALHEYKNGLRNNATMHAIASGLSDKDMADLAAYYGAPTTTTAAK